MGDHTGDDDHGLDGGGLDGLDGGGLVSAFERARARAASEGEEPRAQAEQVLEAAAYVVALEAIGRLGSIGRAEGMALASRARRTLLTTAGLAADEDERDALELAARYAREGLRALSGTAPEPRDEDDAAPPPVRELVRFVRGELDGFAAADVAMRLRSSRRGREELARFVPSMLTPSAQLRVAADSLSFDAGVLRDPGQGRAIGTLAIPSVEASEAGALEAFVFADGVLAIYADPPRPLSVSAGGTVARGQSAGYVELPLPSASGTLALRVEYGERVIDWSLTL